MRKFSSLYVASIITFTVTLGMTSVYGNTNVPPPPFMLGEREDNTVSSKGPCGVVGCKCPCSVGGECTCIKTIRVNNANEVIIDKTKKSNLPYDGQVEGDWVFSGKDGYWYQRPPDGTVRDGWTFNAKDDHWYRYPTTVNVNTQTSQCVNGVCSTGSCAGGSCGSSVVGSFSGSSGCAGGQCGSPMMGGSFGGSPVMGGCAGGSCGSPMMSGGFGGGSFGRPSFGGGIPMMGGGGGCPGGNCRR